MTQPNLIDNLAPPSEQSLTIASAAVLDTNVVLDWLLFGDPGVTVLSQAIVAGRVRWIATASMRDELFHVAGRRWAVARGVDSALLAAVWSCHCSELPQPPPASTRLSCTDPNDQMFVDLALGSGARWLVSRDRALLKLRRRAALRNLVIATPEQWQNE